MRLHHISVMGKPIKIDYVDQGHADLTLDGDSCYGMNVHREQRIIIDCGLPLEMEQDTVLHEILHSIEHGMGMDLDDAVVNRMSSGLLAVIKANPELLRYLGQRCRDGS